MRKGFIDLRATLGEVSNSEHSLESWAKQGRRVGEVSGLRFEESQ